MRTDRDHWFLRDGDETIVLGLVADHLSVVRRNVMGWCLSSYRVVTIYVVDYTGQIANVVPQFTCPCSFPHGDLDPAGAATAFRTKTLGQRGGLRAGRFVVWVADKQIVPDAVPV